MRLPSFSVSSSFSSILRFHRLSPIFLLVLLVFIAPPVNSCTSSLRKPDDAPLPSRKILPGRVLDLESWRLAQIQSEIPRPLESKVQDPWNPPAWCRGYDCPKFDVVGSIGADGDLREYQPGVWVSTTVLNQNWDVSYNMGVDRLKRYRKSKGNVQHQALPDTAPTLAIFHTAPNRSRTVLSTYDIQYFLPYASQASPPAPTAPDVQLLAAPLQRVWVQAFGGYPSGDDVIDRAFDFMEELESQGHKVIREHFGFGVYDTIMHLVDRHNEIWIFADPNPSSQVAFAAASLPLASSLSAWSSENLPLSSIPSSSEAHSLGKFRGEKGKLRNWNPPEWCRGYDCPEFKVSGSLPGDKGVELRTYEPSTWIATDVKVVDGDTKAAYVTGYKRLLDYMSGQNEAGMQLPNTAPTATLFYPKWTGKGILSRSASSSTQGFHKNLNMKNELPIVNDTYTFSYFLPYSFQESPPQPTSKDLRIFKMEKPHSLWARSFGGFATPEQIEREAVDLLEALQRLKYKVRDDVLTFALYDKITQVVGRHNEVWVFSDEDVGGEGRVATV